VEVITQQYVQDLLKPRTAKSHKGNFGHALIVAGSKGKMGAAVLASKACLRSGVGLLTTHVPQCGLSILQTTVLEAMVEIDSDHNIFTDKINLGKFTTVGIGPGLGTDPKTQLAVEQLLSACDFPVVIDADALNCLSLKKDSFSLIPNKSILTPHPGEFERMVGAWETDEQKLEKQLTFSREHSCYIVLKGHHTVISTPEGNLYRNQTGNPGMAKGGSGDALTGIITAFLAQGYTSEDAAILSVYVHGLAGDLAVEEKTEHSLLASDLIEFLPQAFKVID
jgi:NAD(P)H-hydrate epimerase